MRELYRRIREADPKEEIRVLTILGGKAAGAKALVSGRSLLWSSRKGLFPETCPEELPACGICSLGGQEVFSELLTAGKKLVICGGGHVSVPVVRIGKMLGFHVTVLEDRQQFADRAAAWGADRVITAPFAEGLQQVRSDADTYFVVVTRAHRHDAECLRRILPMPHAYAGMMGSRSRAAMVKELLAEEGLDRTLVDSVHTPIGLKIGAETPEEIAVSVLAEIIEVKNREGRSAGYPEPLLDAILALPEQKVSGEEAGPEKAGDGILAVIVRKRGAAPRQPGTKMLLRPDGSAAGTVGGGSAEAMITRAAREMFSGKESFRMLHLDLSSDTAGEEGMVCGGTLDVMLERV